MAREVVYGIISDVHEDPRTMVPLALHVLKAAGVHKLIVNGDIGGWYGDINTSQMHSEFILKCIGASGLEAYVQPGSHEPLSVYGPVLKNFTEKYSSIIDAIATQKVSEDGHDMVFIPGSDFLCGGEYSFGAAKGLESGDYVFPFNDRPIRCDDALQASRLGKGMIEVQMYYTSLEDVRKKITRPEQTIIICHVPRKFDNLPLGVDVAYFGEATTSFRLGDDNVQTNSIFPFFSALKLARQGAPVRLKRENRGSTDLQKLFAEAGITKAVNGHFHESSHHAHDSSGNFAKEGVYASDLFYNSGRLDRGYCGIIKVRGEQVSYQNLRLPWEPSST